MCFKHYFILQCNFCFPGQILQIIQLKKNAKCYILISSEVALDCYQQYVFLGDWTLANAPTSGLENRLQQSYSKKRLLITVRPLISSMINREKKDGWDPVIYKLLS